MNLENNSLSLELPLSWVRSNTKHINKTEQKFLINGINWVSLAEIPRYKKINSIISKLKTQSPQGLIIRGCNPKLERFLKSLNFESFAVGQESIIDLNKNAFEKKSLKELVRRGEKQGRFKKVKLDFENIKRLNALRTKSAHANKPQLNNLFITQPSINTDIFIWENAGGNWDAAISLSKTNNFKIQTELLIRDKNAPTGTMEALIYSTSLCLKNDGFKMWSLGEVPFIFPKNYDSNFREKLVSMLGRKLPFAYNAQGLYAFKDKFTTEWQPIYICGFPNISILSLFQLAYYSNYMRLACHQLLNKLTLKK